MGSKRATLPSISHPAAGPIRIVSTRTRCHRLELTVVPLVSMLANFLIHPETKRYGRFRRSTRKESLHAVSSLLTRQSEYLRNLLSGEFQEAAETPRERSRAETRAPTAGAEDDNDETIGASSLEEWQAYFSDSDVSYYDDDEEDNDSDVEIVAAPSVDSTSRSPAVGAIPQRPRASRPQKKRKKGRKDPVTTGPATRNAASIIRTNPAPAASNVVSVCAASARLHH